MSEESHTIEIDDKPYTFKLFVYDPPYFHTKPLAGPQVSDLSTPEGADLAIQSSLDREDVDWFLSLHDEAARERWIKKNQEHHVFDSWSSARLPVDDLSKEDAHEIFGYKVEFEEAGVRYAVISANLVENGTRYDYPSFKSFVLENGKWLVTDRRLPLTSLVRIPLNPSGDSDFKSSSHSDSIRQSLNASQNP